MGKYQSFAGVYDCFMDEVDYQQWIQHMQEIWTQLGKKPEAIIDLGCGTGSATIALAKAGHSVAGVDLSEDMLAEAQRKAYAENLNISFFCQDMTELDLPYTADCIISLCDSLNYLTEDGELSAAFAAVKAHLHSGGLFLFDLNTEYKFMEVLGNKTYAATTEDSAYFWENSYDADEKINEYYVCLFLRQTGRDTYERSEEYHYERAYALDEVKRCLAENSFDVLAVYDGYSFDAAHAQSQRYLFVAQVR